MSRFQPIPIPGRNDNVPQQSDVSLTQTRFIAPRENRTLETIVKGLNDAVGLAVKQQEVKKRDAEQLSAKEREEAARLATDSYLLRRQEYLDAKEAYDAAVATGSEDVDARRASYAETALSYEDYLEQLSEDGSFSGPERKAFQTESSNVANTATVVTGSYQDSLKRLEEAKLRQDMAEPLQGAFDYATSNEGLSALYGSIKITEMADGPLSFADRRVAIEGAVLHIIRQQALSSGVEEEAIEELLEANKDVIAEKVTATHRKLFEYEQGVQRREREAYEIERSDFAAKHYASVFINADEGNALAAYEMFKQAGGDPAAVLARVGDIVDEQFVRENPYAIAGIVKTIKNSPLTNKDSLIQTIESRVIERATAVHQSPFLSMVDQITMASFVQGYKDANIPLPKPIQDMFEKPPTQVNKIGAPIEETDDPLQSAMDSRDPQTAQAAVDTHVLRAIAQRPLSGSLEKSEVEDLTSPDLTKLMQLNSLRKLDFDMMRRSSGGLTAADQYVMFALSREDWSQYVEDPANPEWLDRYDAIKANAEALTKVQLDNYGNIRASAEGKTKAYELPATGNAREIYLLDLVSYINNKEVDYADPDALKGAMDTVYDSLNNSYTLLDSGDVVPIEMEVYSPETFNQALSRGVNNTEEVVTIKDSFGTPFSVRREQVFRSANMKSGSLTPFINIALEDGYILRGSDVWRKDEDIMDKHFSRSAWSRTVQAVRGAYRAATGQNIEMKHAGGTAILDKKKLGVLYMANRLLSYDNLRVMAKENNISSAQQVAYDLARALSEGKVDTSISNGRIKVNASLEYPGDQGPVYLNFSLDQEELNEMTSESFVDKLVEERSTHTIYRGAS